MKKIRISLLAAAATLFTLLASMVASTACFWGCYQPEEPSSLQDK